MPPNAGTTCSSEGLECKYQCGQNGAVTCSGGMWEFANGGPCPISTRKAKTAISYLSEADLALVARDVESMKLATWDYKNPKLEEGRRHMGIILEDEPQGSYAVDPPAQMVDLYGYASMLVATVQVQKRTLDRQQGEIDALRKELAAMRDEMRRHEARK